MPWPRWPTPWRPRRPRSRASSASRPSGRWATWPASVPTTRPSTARSSRRSGAPASPGSASAWPRCRPASPRSRDAVTAVRALADRYLLESCALDPIRSTSLGVPGYERLLTDYSPEGVAARATLAREALTELDAVPTDDDADRRCASLLRDRLGTELDLVEAGEPLRSLRIIGSPVGSLRSVFDLMAHDTPEQWADAAARMGGIPGAYAPFEASLREGVHRGLFAAPRQAEACAEQAATWAGQRDRAPWFETLAASAPDGVRPEAEAQARRATEALAALAAYLRDEYVPAAAGTPDPVGRERYAQLARVHLGSTIDLDEAYAWGWDELRRIEDEMAAVAERIVPGGGIDAAMAHLDAHGEVIEGEPALKAWLQDLMDRTIAELDGTHFAIAGPVRTVEPMIAPPGTPAAQYSTAPSADFSRPGRT